MLSVHVSTESKSDLQRLEACLKYIKHRNGRHVLFKCSQELLLLEFAECMVNTSWYIQMHERRLEKVKY